MIRASRFPDALTFLFLCLIAAAALTWILPAGEYQRRQDPATARVVVVPNTYHRVAASPVGPFAALVAIPRGFTSAASVIGFVLLVGAGIAVVDKTGAFADGVDHLIAVLGDRSALMLPIIGIVFAAGGVVEGMMEEIIPLVPVLLMVGRRLGYRPVVAVGAPFAFAVAGGAFSPMNPFQVGIAQRLAGVPLFSGWALRIAFLIPAIVLCVGWTLRARHGHRDHAALAHADDVRRVSARTLTILGCVLAAIATYVIGVINFGWEFDQMGALFVLLGIVAGLIGGLGVAGTTTALAEGFRGMAVAAVLIGVARAIYLVLQDGRIIDTIVHGLFVPVSQLPSIGAGVGMMFAQMALHVPVPSTTGQAVLSMPILVPLSDLLGLPAQAAVLAYQFGGGLCEMLTPTNGAMMAILAAAGISYEDWIRFAFPLLAMLTALAVIALAVAIAFPSMA